MSYSITLERRRSASKLTKYFANYLSPALFRCACLLLHLLAINPHPGTDTAALQSSEAELCVS